MNKLTLSTLCATVLALTGCVAEGSRVIAPTTTQAAMTASTYQGIKSVISVGKFENKSSYQNGIFSDGADQLGNQSKTILISHLQQTGRFSVLDRSNMNEIATEAKIKGKKQNLKGSTYVVTGDVTEFGRKTVGDHQLFGILGRGKEQVAYAKVTLNVVDVLSSEVVYSVQGAGEYNLSNREVLGFGGTAGYDSTLNGKVLDLAIREAVNNLVNGIETGRWSPSNK
ncbi:CsgG/HfaB family protein [Glaesserella sp.]|uniref:CsgG/HfaB family protein n=1 Tax=Glaesserella sp. TaxID=2094731 RepID=UPI0035A0C45D